MAAVLANLVAGHYSVTWNGVALGATEDGWTITMTPKGEVVTAEEWGDNELDIIHRGVTVTLDAVIKEWTTGLVQAIWFAHATFGQQSCVGQSAVLNSLVKPMVFTPACANSTADASTVGLGNATTFHQCIMTPDSAAKINLNNKPRVVPVQFTALLSLESTLYKHFTTA
jgi:hypothetical protein